MSNEVRFQCELGVRSDMLWKGFRVTGVMLDTTYAHSMPPDKGDVHVCGLGSPIGIKQDKVTELVLVESLSDKHVSQLASAATASLALTRE